jgi:predicted ester cyclase
MVDSPGRERRVGKEGKEAPVSAEENNKALARKFFEEAWGKGNLAAVDEFIAAEYVMYPIASGLPPGPEGTKRAITTYRTAFPDLQVTVDDIFAAADRVAFRWSFRGTHLGDWLDIPPTGNHMAATGISVYRMAGGKVVENWTNIDLSPTEEEQRWLMEGGGWPGRSPDIPAAERDTSRSLIWDVLTRNLTWRFRVAEAQERERIEQELKVSRRIQQASQPRATPHLERYFSELTRHSFPTSQPTRSLPASTPSSIPRVGYCATPTPVMTCLTYIMMARPKNLGPEGCPWA